MPQVENSTSNLLWLVTAKKKVHWKYHINCYFLAQHEVLMNYKCISFFFHKWILYLDLEIWIPFPRYLIIYMQMATPPKQKEKKTDQNHFWSQAFWIRDTQPVFSQVRIQPLLKHLYFQGFNFLSKVFAGDHILSASFFILVL